MVGLGGAVEECDVVSFLVGSGVGAVLFGGFAFVEEAEEGGYGEAGEEGCGDDGAVGGWCGHAGCLSVDCTV